MEFELSGWSNHTPKDIPHQQNGSDCGVFMCMVSELHDCTMSNCVSLCFFMQYARYLAARSPFTFSQVSHDHGKYS